jgi:ribosomal protein L11 methylase PrmA
MNHLERQIIVSDRSLETVEDEFGLIAANLRSPSLVKLAPHLTNRAAADARLVLAGIRPDELAGLLDCFSVFGFKPFWAEQELEWAAAALR